MDHVRSGLGLRTGALLDVEIDAVDVVLVEPGRHLLSHGLGGRLAGQPVPRVVQEAAKSNKKDTLMATGRITTGACAKKHYGFFFDEQDEK